MIVHLLLRMHNLSAVDAWLTRPLLPCEVDPRPTEPLFDPTFATSEIDLENWRNVTPPTSPGGSPTRNTCSTLPSRRYLLVILCDVDKCQ